MKSRQRLVRLTLGIAALTIAVEVLPQESSAGLIEEIIVTAQNAKKICRKLRFP